VRKAAVRILWEACIQVAAFPKASEACVAVLHRVADSEESIQDLVGKVFHGLWFASRSEGMGRPYACYSLPVQSALKAVLDSYCPDFGGC
jgi:hypothetical protein